MLSFVAKVLKVLRVLRGSNLPIVAGGIIAVGVAPWRRGGEAGDRNVPKGHIVAETEGVQVGDIMAGLVKC